MKGLDCRARGLIIVSLLRLASHRRENRDSPTYRLQCHHHNQEDTINRTITDITLFQKLNTLLSRKHLT